jgi:hypothetical protein
LDEIEIALPNNDGDDYELVFDEGPTKEQAKAAAEEERKDALANVSNQHYMQSYKKGEVNVDSRYTYHHHARNKSIGSKRVLQKKEKVHDGAKEVHLKCLQKTKRDSNKFKGWSEEQNVFMVKMVKAIRDDVESGAHGKWEKLYKKICDAINKSDQIHQGSSSSDDKMDYSVMYAEV